MRFRKGVFQFERFPGCCLRLGHSLLRTLATVEGEKRIGIGQTGIRQCVIRILADRVFKILDGRSQIGSCALVEKKCAFEIQLVCLGILRRPGGNGALLGAAKSRLQRVGDCFRDLAFNAKDVR